MNEAKHSDRSQPTLERQEALVEQQTTVAHKEIIGILRDMGNSLIDGFNSLGGEVMLPDEDRLLRAWLLLLAHSTQTWVCAWHLSVKGYYSQSITLLRTMTEDYLVALDCQCTSETLRCVLGDATKHRWNFKKMAERVGQNDVAYDVEYVYQCSFAHPDRSIRTLISPEHGGLVTAPEYDELLFLSCCELNLRACLRTLDVMHRFLSRANPDGVAAWCQLSDERTRTARQWYRTMRTRYGSGDSL